MLAIPWAGRREFFAESVHQDFGKVDRFADDLLHIEKDLVEWVTRWVMCGRRRLGKNFLTCCSIGRVRSCVRPVCAAVKPLAIMLCADRVPIRSTHSTMR